MKKLVLLFFICGCSPKYEVVQQMGPDRFHIVGVKDKEAIILYTKLKLKEGQIVKWKDVKK